MEKDKILDEMVFISVLHSGLSAECAICNEEKRGQSFMTSGVYLPIKGSRLSEDEVRSKYQDLGIKVIEKGEDFYSVELPDNLEIIADENVYWSTLRFKAGKEIARIFCKKIFMMVETNIYFL